ncbi:MAG TPA: hypothetical protein VKA46_02025 [Gemmataceae bacterium]|nr:hypothetical protein [Gemmataceae bacterium]
MRFPYTPLRTKAPVVSLGGRQERPRPIVTITLIGPTGSRAIEGGLDSHADDTVFPEQYAVQIGIDLTNAPRGTAAGIGQVPVPVKYALVTLRLTDGVEQREWTGWVGFTPVLSRYALLGFAGCLQFFTATFFGDLEEVELTVNSLYRGT